MKLKKLPLVTLILSTVFMVSCTAGGTITANPGPVIAGIATAFSGLFTPTVPTSATGDADLNIKSDQTSCNVDAHFQNLSSDETEAQIETDDPANPVIATLPLGQVNNVTVNLTTVQVNIINTHNTFINIRTKSHPDGEIRCKLNKK